MRIDLHLLNKTRYMINSNYYFAPLKACHTKLDNRASHLPHTFRPKMNVQTKEDQITLEFSLAGVLKEDLKVSIKDSMLSFEASRKEHANQMDYRHREFGPVTFKADIRLPQDVSNETIHAQFLNGILRISMRLLKKQSIQVEIN